MHLGTDRKSGHKHKPYIITGLACTLTAVMFASFWGAPVPLLGSILYWAYWSFWGFCVYFLYKKASPLAKKILVLTVFLFIGFTFFKTAHTLFQHMQQGKNCASIIYIGESWNYPKVKMPFGGVNENCTPDFPLRDSFNAIDKILNITTGRPFLGALYTTVFLLFPLFLIGKGFFHLDRSAQRKQSFFWRNYLHLSYAADRHLKDFLLILPVLGLLIGVYLFLSNLDKVVSCPIDTLWGFIHGIVIYIIFPTAFLLLPWFFKIKCARRHARDLHGTDRKLFYFSIISIVCLLLLLPPAFQDMFTSGIPAEDKCR